MAALDARAVRAQRFSRAGRQGLRQDGVRRISQWCRVRQSKASEAIAKVNPDGR